MKAVAYYRTRPGEPEASDLALRLQREAVQRDIEGSGLELVAEFVEREGEAGNEGYPAYVAAVCAAVAHGEEGKPAVALIVASRAAIGSGEVFREPRVEGGSGVLHYWLDEPLVPTPPEIALPAGAPAPLCLYADFRPRQLDTLVYLCNAGSAMLAAVAVVTDTIDMSQFYTSELGERWAGVDDTREQQWDVMPPGTGVLVNSLGHVVWDMVSRYRLAFTDASGRRWAAEADDLALNACRLAQNPDRVWVAFGPVRLAAQTGAVGRPEETS